MSQPTTTDLGTLDYVSGGTPFYQVEAKTIGTETLDIPCQGTPFFAIGPSGGPPPVVYNATQFFAMF